MSDGFAASLAALASVMNEPMPTERIVGYCAILNEFEEDQLVAACAVLGKSGRFFPKPCDFVDLIKSGQLPGENNESAAALAWGQIMAAGSSIKAINDLGREDYRIAGGITACGDAYCIINGDDDLKWKRRAFIQGFCASVSEERRQIMGAVDPRRLPPPDIMMLEDGSEDE